MSERRQMVLNQRVTELAERVLNDADLATDENVGQLAMEIQAAIDDFIAGMQRKAAK